MLTRAAITHSRIQVLVLPSSTIGRTDGMLPGREDGFFEGLFDGRFDDDDDDDAGDERGPELGLRDGMAAGLPDTPGGGPDARSVSLVGWMAASTPPSFARSFTEEAAATEAGAPIAGIVTANASVPAGEVANALGDSDTTSSGRARACMMAAASADADG